MKMKSLAVLLGLGLAPVAAQAQQFLPMEQDTQVQGAIFQMYSAFGNACQMGDQQACQGVQYLQNLAGYMQQASWACQQGQPQGCQAYQQAYYQLDADYGQFMAYMAQMQQQQPMMPQTTHDQRLQQIQQWGQQMNQNAINSQNALDNSHAQFMEYLRQ